MSDWCRGAARHHELQCRRAAFGGYANYPSLSAKCTSMNVFGALREVWG